MNSLDEALARVNALASTATALPADLEARVEFPVTRLAVYGTLMPGQSNHHLLSNVGGVWAKGTVEGTRFMARGYPAFKWRPGMERVPVSVLTSTALPAHWARLDRFEGVDYRRILVPVRLANATSVVAYLYEYIPT